MFIHEAVSVAITKGCRIARKSQPEFTIEPTDSIMCCIIHGPGKMKPGPRWNPYASDLIANDWILV